MKSLEALKAACDSIVNDPALRPVKDADGRIIETFCNRGAMRVALAMGCSELAGQMADRQHETMCENMSKLWSKVSGGEATAWALSGGLAFAAMTSTQLDELHGHIAAIYPEPMEYSPSLFLMVPVVANVGKTNEEEKESSAFPVKKGQPDYFTWDG